MTGSFANNAQSHNGQLPDEQFVRQLLRDSRQVKSVSGRMKLLSERLLGFPYNRKPLIGSPTQPEVLVTRMDSFDCLTFLETVLALARIRSTEEFPAEIRNIRYSNGEVSYRSRLHYTTDWSRHQVEHGRLTEMTLGEETLSREKPLFFLKSLPPKLAHYRYFPKHRIDSVSRWLLDSDIIYFVSGREGLDIGHLGLIVRDNQRLLMRHAARSHRQVIEQELGEFFRLNKMSGFIINRPREI